MADTTPLPIDLTELLKPYTGQWVALSQDETTVLGHGETLDEVLEQAKEKTDEEPVLMKVPGDDGGFVLI